MQGPRQKRLSKHYIPIIPGYNNNNNNIKNNNIVVRESRHNSERRVASLANQSVPFTRRIFIISRKNFSSIRFDQDNAQYIIRRDKLHWMRKGGDYVILP